MHWLLGVTILKVPGMRVPGVLQGVVEVNEALAENLDGVKRKDREIENKGVLKEEKMDLHNEQPQCLDKQSISNVDFHFTTPSTKESDRSKIVNKVYTSNKINENYVNQLISGPFQIFIEEQSEKPDLQRDLSQMPQDGGKRHKTPMGGPQDWKGAQTPLSKMWEKCWQKGNSHTGPPFLQERIPVSLFHLRHPLP